MPIAARIWASTKWPIRDSNGLLNFFDELWVTHSSHVALGSDIDEDSFKSHDGAGSDFFNDVSLFRGEERFFSAL